MCIQYRQFWSVLDNDSDLDRKYGEPPQEIWMCDLLQVFFRTAVDSIYQSDRNARSLLVMLSVSFILCCSKLSFLSLSLSLSLSFFVIMVMPSQKSTSTDLICAVNTAENTTHHFPNSSIFEELFCAIYLDKPTVPLSLAAKDFLPISVEKCQPALSSVSTSPHTHTHTHTHRHTDTQKQDCSHNRHFLLSLDPMMFCKCLWPLIKLMISPISPLSPIFSLFVLHPHFRSSTLKQALFSLSLSTLSSRTLSLSPPQAWIEKGSSWWTVC